MSSRRAFLECLENRRVFAADWHNLFLPCDVDGSGAVTDRDVVAVFDAINEVGVRRLGLSSGLPTTAFLDVNGDGMLAAIDALLVVNALNREYPLQEVAIEVAADADPNRNYVTLDRSLIVDITATPFSRVAISRESNGDQASELIDFLVLDESGMLNVTIPLIAGPNAIRIEAFNEIGDSAAETQMWVAGDAIVDWNASILKAVRDWTVISDDPQAGTIIASPPPVVARNLAMIHLAMFDAANAVELLYDNYLSDLPSDVEASAVAAASQAAFEVASKLYPENRHMELWDATHHSILASLADSSSTQRQIERGIELGRVVGEKMWESRRADGSDDLGLYSPSGLPGGWGRTPPRFLAPLLPAWGSVTSFSGADISIFRPAPPPGIETPEYAAAVDEVLRLGERDSQLRTEDQTDIAYFWASGPGTATPPGHWNRIAADVVAAREYDLLENARIFALLNMALADAGIASWDTKYEYDLWRPIDAIRHADQDGNSDTYAVDDWTSLLITPPFPTYTSGHSTFSGAAAGVLTELLGDNVSFSSTSEWAGGAVNDPHNIFAFSTRQYTSFRNAASEAGMSRIYGGIHFSFDNTAGLQSGDEIASFITNQFLKLR